MKIDKQQLVEMKEEIKHSAMSLQMQATLFELLRGVDVIETNEEVVHDNTCQ